jgi:hypothetical protein
MSRIEFNVSFNGEKPDNYKLLKADIIQTNVLFALLITIQELKV